MKISAALAAVAAVALAPLAASQAICGDPTVQTTVRNLAITSTIKRTTVKGNSRIVQTIKVTNNNGATVNNIKFGTFWASTSDAIKANARAPGAGKVSVTIDNNANTAISHGFSLPSGKTLKATIAFRAVQCPPASPANVFEFGASAVNINAEDLQGACATVAAPTDVTINRAKTCT